MSTDHVQADPSYVLARSDYELARSDYDLGWWSGFQGEQRPALGLVVPNMDRGFAVGVWQRTTWVGNHTARILGAKLRR